MPLKVVVGPCGVLLPSSSSLQDVSPHARIAVAASMAARFRNMPPFALQKDTFCRVKGYLLEGKRYPFITCWLSYGYVVDVSWW